MTKVSFIGAGSTVFAKNMMGDIWSYPELADAAICLMDIDPKRLRQSEQVARHVIQALDINPNGRMPPPIGARRWKARIMWSA